MADDVLALIAALQDEAAAHLRGDDPSLTERTLQLTGARARRLAATRDRLAKELGEDHPRVVQLTDRQTRQSRIASDLADLADRQRDPAQPADNEWRLQGRVTDRAGGPVVGARVHVVRREQGDEIGEPASTDKRGGYSLTVDLRRTPDVREVMVRVVDRDGTELLRADEPLRPAAGETDLADIVVRRTHVERASARARCEAMTARGTRCRNLARPGSRFCAVHAED